MTTESAQLRRFGSDMYEYSGHEEVAVQKIGGTLYCSASELACLRIFAKYHLAPNVRLGYSENEKSWYVSVAL